MKPALKAGNKPHKTRFYFFILFFVMLAAIPLVSYAAFVSPPLVFIENNQRTAQITINNRGAVPKIFRFSWEHRTIGPDGKSLKLKEGETVPGYRPAEPYLRYSPRQVTLKPGQHQKISFLVQRPADMEPGEYHSHFLIEEEPLARKKKKKIEQGLVGGRLDVRVNKSIPFFLRHGETKIDLTIRDAYIHKINDEYRLHIDVQSNSTRSIYAPVVLSCASEAGAGVEKMLSLLRIYVELDDVVSDLDMGDFPMERCGGGLQVRVEGGKDYKLYKQTLASSPVSVR